jgi:hypothetical protein
MILFMKKHNGMRPQDVIVMLKLISRLKIPQKMEAFGDTAKNIQSKIIAKQLQMSEAEVSDSIKRSEYAGLIADKASKKVNLKSLLEFLLHGIQYVFPTQPGALVRGIPTAHAAAPLKNSIISDELFVWEHPEGTVRGQAIIPLYHTVPNIVQEDEKLYELLALVDAIRTGTARIKGIATKELEKRILNVW